MHSLSLVIMLSGAEGYERLKIFEAPWTNVSLATGAPLFERDGPLLGREGTEGREGREGRIADDGGCPGFAGGALLRLRCAAAIPAERTVAFGVLVVAACGEGECQGGDGQADCEFLEEHS